MHLENAKSGVSTPDGFSGFSSFLARDEPSARELYCLVRTNAGFDFAYSDFVFVFVLKLISKNSRRFETLI